MNKIATLILVGMLSCFVASADLPWLKVDGKNIVDEKGAAVSLRGINLGSWLMMETWISSFGLSDKAHMARLAEESGISQEKLSAVMKKTGEFNDDFMTLPKYTARILTNVAALVGEDKAAALKLALEREPVILDAATVDRVLTQRFGADGAKETWSAFHEKWIGNEDFRRVKEMGFNFVRVPFWYRWIEDDSAVGVYREDGFRLLESAVSLAKANGLYALLDMHGAPGGQNVWEHSGEMGKGVLFRNDGCQKRTCDLWTAVAGRFKDEPAVLGYGCLNEPASARDAKNWADVHDLVYRAIRLADDRHMIQMEDGYKTDSRVYQEKGFFPAPLEKDWKNVFYSIHFYQTGSMDKHEKEAGRILTIAKREQERCEVPIYLGEFNTINNDETSIKAMDMYLKRFNGEGLHWSPWTFKYVGGDNTTWGVYQYDGAWETIDLHRDSKEEVLRKIGNYDASHFKTFGAFAEVIRQNLTVPVPDAK